MERVKCRVGKDTGRSGLLASSLLCRVFRQIPLFGESLPTEVGRPRKPGQGFVWADWRTTFALVQCRGLRDLLDWRSASCGFGHRRQRGKRAGRVQRLTRTGLRTDAAPATSFAAASRCRLRRARSRRCAFRVTMASGHRMRSTPLTGKWMAEAVRIPVGRRSRGGSGA